MIELKSYVLGVQDGASQGGVTPTGNIEITDMEITDVAAYATAQVVDENIVAANIKKDVEILGVTGTFDPQPDLTDITINANGTYTHSGHDGYDEVTVNVPVPTLIGINIDQNGTIEAEEGYAWDVVNVEVEPTLQDKTITANGTYSADEGYDGLGEVTVNVSGGVETLTLTGDIGDGFRGHIGAEVVQRIPIETEDITSVYGTFAQFTGDSIPFSLNFEENTPVSFYQTFLESNIKTLPQISDVRVWGPFSTFNNAMFIRATPHKTHISKPTNQ